MSHEYAGGWSEYERAGARPRAQQYEAPTRTTSSERDRFERRARRPAERGAPHGAAQAREGARGSARPPREKQALEAKVRAAERSWSGSRWSTSRGRAGGSQLVVRARRRAAATSSPSLDGAVIERGRRSGSGRSTSRSRWQDRLAILGPNGAGKSTLLRALLGELPLARGRRWLGPGVSARRARPGARAPFAGDDALLDTFTERDRRCALSEARSLLAKFGARRRPRRPRPAPRSHRASARRAALALLMAAGVNCLVLDEPTNHLDLEAIEQLEEALAATRARSSW